MKSWFLKKEYPEKLIESELRKIKFCKEGIKKAKGDKGIPFVVLYHLQLKSLGKIINQNIYLLNMNLFSYLCIYLFIKRSSTVDFRLGSKYASAYIYIQVLPREIICILNIFAVKYTFSDKRRMK